MKVISKFIINRNNLMYIYVEKVLINNEPIYYVYSEDGKEILPSYHFQSIFGNDKKISIYDFLILMQTTITGNSIDIEENDVLYKKINKLLKEIKNMDRKNPLLGNYSYNVCKLLDIYNNLICVFLETNDKNFSLSDCEIDYEEEYQRLIKQEF